jgi:glutamate--cysteine ligase
MYRPHATSLRMGPLGYQSDAQASLAVSYNCLVSYGKSLQGALTRPYPAYETIGVREPGVPGDGVDSYRQLATSLLQIENEFYGTIRPKRVIRQGERPLHALRERGVEYVEVRLMDLNPFEPVGITAATIRLLDVFLLHCLLSESPEDTPQEIAANARNQHRVAARGREPGLRLERNGEEAGLREWGGGILSECGPIASALDSAHGGAAYRDALSAAVAALDAPETLPSARVLKTMSDEHANTYVRFVLQQSRNHRASIEALALPSDVESGFAQMAAASIEEQRKIESADTLPFEIYRQKYLSPERLGI